MNGNVEIHDNPADWVAEHIKSYVATNGEDGHEWKGVPTLLLTTTGRSPGKMRRTALIYGRDSNRYVVVASKGGHVAHPAWYLNLSANPAVEVQVGGEKFTATATTAGPGDKARIWPVMTAIWPAYDEYQTKTEREIPVVVLERNG